VNNQLFENSFLKELMADDDTVAASPTAFFNQKDPNLACLHEKPEHRMMMMMKIRGVSNRELAVATGYTEAWVSQLMRQPWARRFMAETLHEAGSDGVSEMLKGAALDSVLTLIELRDDAASPKAVRRQSAVDLLDRHFGKPLQRVESTASVQMDVTSVNAIDSELAELDRQEKQLLGRG
jgi:hypothetical protein